MQGPLFSNRAQEGGGFAGRAPSGSDGEYGVGGAFGYSIDIITGTGRSGENWIVDGAGVRIGTAVGLGRGAGIVVGVAITGE